MSDHIFWLSQLAPGTEDCIIPEVISKIAEIDYSLELSHINQPCLEPSRRPNP